MDLSEKIKLILSQKGISPSLFADEIGIQRSSISHILAGRNKPSLDIVQKIIKRFPELGINWILDGEELPAIELSLTSSKPVVIAKESVKKGSPNTSLEFHREKQPELATVQESRKPIKPPIQTGKVIDKILIFYSDGTFQEFKQNI